MAKRKSGKTKKMGSGDVDPTYLRNLMDEVIALDSEAAVSRGDAGAAIKAAADEHNIHKKAFRFCKLLKRMEPQMRVAMLRAFDSYRSILALDDSPDLFDEDEPRTLGDAAQGVLEGAGAH